MFRQKKIIQVLLIALYMTSCKSDENNSIVSNEKKGVKNVALKNLQGIGVFKKGITINEVKQFLNNNKISFGEENSSEKYETIKIMKINISDVILDSCLVQFYRDTIIYFNYKSRTENERVYLQNKKPAGVEYFYKQSNPSIFTDEIKTGNVIKDLYNRMYYKYAEPLESLGTIGNPTEIGPVFTSGKNSQSKFRWSNYDSTLVVILEEHRYKTENCLNLVKLPSNINTDILFGNIASRCEFRSYETSLRIEYDIPKINQLDIIFTKELSKKQKNEANRIKDSLKKTYKNF